MKPVFLVSAFAVIAVAAGSAFFATGGNASSLPHLSAETVAMGAEIYAENCASCHGAALEGEENWRERDADGYLPAPPHDASGHTWHHPTEQLFEITKYGTETVVGGGYRSNMAGFGDILTDDEIRAVLAYIKSTWPDRIIERHNELDAAYKASQQ
ncbi:c-type cytochrome [Alphaproteobacteria bacterium GH1-50]|uniref:C-type cytochrome n=1 Tax=Kangsaoukella pontilimi TaxID=2691042 RepID=A0A7C9MKB5_9RHOB|nr:cytochrome c [Kangsaoukella pontilimi]MXQ08375.1 c-type cytochrome [Kangsaoukella pontilimi]